ncbi:MAG: molybdopterin molybdotransferase MoeA [Polyangiaceae bacterium]|nr:molybdopterin molybdotransferase MoeA [Polyangiaceae bacterium]
MLPFEEALERVLGNARRLGSERVAVGDALGRVLAETLRADSPMPAFDYSAMDGYAVASSGFHGAMPVTLPVVGESQTGHEPPALTPGTACRIFTGAVLPAGADAVVMQENVERDGDRATFSAQPKAGDHVRHAGEDLAVGQVAVKAGTRLGGGQLGLCAALDRAHVHVARRPRVTIVCTGDELRAPGEKPWPGSIPESNGIALSGWVRQAGGEPVIAPLARDDREATSMALRTALAESDVVLTVGGVSVGDHDVVRPALEAAGATLDFYKVRIKPGKPLVFGNAGTTHVLGLPGNPVSAQVTFALFGMALLRTMQGDAQARPPLRRGRLAKPLRQKPGRRGYYRAQHSAEGVIPLDNQASGAPTSMAWADCLVIVPEDSEGFEAGTEVDVIQLGDL